MSWGAPGLAPTNERPPAQGRADLWRRALEADGGVGADQVSTAAQCILRGSGTAV
jgi:hypothetical protein